MASTASDSDDIAAEMARLEAALERIAERSEMAQGRAQAITTPQASDDSPEIARRLDRLIGRLRATDVEK